MICGRCFEKAKDCVCDNSPTPQELASDTDEYFVRSYAELAEIYRKRGDEVQATRYELSSRLFHPPPIVEEFRQDA